MDTTFYYGDLTADEQEQHFRDFQNWLDECERAWQGTPNQDARPIAVEDKDADEWANGNNAYCLLNAPELALNEH